MCVMVYLASAKPLSLVAWEEGSPGFNVTSLAADEGRVAAQFTHQCLVYAGSHEGCGCGFQYAQWPAESYSAEELALSRRSLSAFADFLDAELTRVDAIELFVCWDGDQEEPPEHFRQIRPKDLRKPDFLFLERERSIVIPDGAG